MDNTVTVVILAAGLGTRMKSRQAKVLHRAGGRSLIEHCVAAALAIAPPERVFVVVGHQREQVQAALEHSRVRFVVQTEQKGTGHALHSGRQLLAPLGGLLVIFYGDCPLIPAELLRELVRQQSSSKAAATSVSAILNDATGYGRVIRNETGGITRVVEQKDGTPEQLAIREANVGIYCFRADLFWKHIDELRPNNRSSEYYLTDMVEILAAAGHAVRAMLIDDATNVMGINDRIELAAADRRFRERKARELMLSGVTIEKPETVTIDMQVQIGIDSTVEPFARILGNTVIGEGSRVGACAILTDSELADDVEVGPFTIVGSSRLERGARVGPFARLRFDNHVGEGAHVGNFVEMKKVDLGAGAKAMHLAYLGDASVGRNANIGAGTITCNYDGVKKQRVNIGDEAFVGSNSTLVAPVEIGEGAYLAAGSVITEPVPPDALALGRSRQVNKEAWARRRREMIAEKH